MNAHTLHYAIHEVEPYINWIYFFHAWGFSPRYATIARLHGCDACRAGWLASFPEEERNKAGEAMQLFKDALRMLRQLDKDFNTHARFGIYEAVSDEDDLILFDNGRHMRLPLLRQQHVIRNGDPYLCLSDFVRPVDHNQRDRVGVFATCTDDAVEHLYENGEYADSYRHLLAQTLADRLAEATAERMHEEVRRRYWGYAPREALSINELFQEQYQGIRPAVGYPSLPDQSTNFELDRWLQYNKIGIQLTETGCMRPHAAVSGLMLSHPQARYFAVGKIDDEQLHDYARRKGMPEEYVRQFLAANLPH